MLLGLKCQEQITDEFVTIGNMSIQQFHDFAVKQQQRDSSQRPGHLKKVRDTGAQQLT